MKIRILVFICCFLLCGCQNKKQQTVEKEENLSEYEMLVKGNWSHYNPVIGEMVNMYFSKNDEFIYCCSCGEPVDDSDLYDTYHYEDNRIILKSSYDENIEDINIDVFYIDRVTLLIKMKDDIIEFYNSKTIKNLLDSEDIQCCEKCLENFKDYDGYGYINQMNDDIKFVPVNRDDNNLRHVSVSQDIQYGCLKSNTVFNDSGIVSQHSCSYQALTKNQALKQIKKPVFIWYNDKQEIKKIVFYNSKIS